MPFPPYTFTIETGRSPSRVTQPTPNNPFQSSSFATPSTTFKPTFGLNPRVSPQPTHSQSSSTAALSSRQVTRADPSPKLPHHHHQHQSQQIHSFPTLTTPTNQEYQKQQHEYDPHPLAKRRTGGVTSTESTPFHMFAHRYDKSSRETGSTFNLNSYGTKPTNVLHPGANTSINPFTTSRRSSPRRDADEEDLRQWKQQQKRVDTNNRNYNILKYAFFITASVLIIIIMYLLSRRLSLHETGFGPVLTAIELDTEEVADKLNNLPPRLDSVGGIAPPVVETNATPPSTRTLKPILEQDPRVETISLDALGSLSSPDIDASRRTLAEVKTEAPVRLIDSSSKIRTPTIPTQATTPQSSVHDDASLLARRTASEDDDSEESIETLTHMAEEQAALHAESTEALEAEFGVVKRNFRVIHTGLEEEFDPLDGLLHVPPHPQPNQVNHLMIEKMIHEHTREGSTPRPHSHKDHPSVPKYGRGIPHIPMPAPEKEKRKPEPPSVSPSEESLTDPSAPATPAATETESVLVEDDLLSMLSEAPHPIDVSADVELVTEGAGKLTGLHGPVIKGANAEAHQLAATTDLQAGQRVASKPVGLNGTNELQSKATDAPDPSPTSFVQSHHADAAAKKMSELEFSLTKARNLGEQIGWTLPILTKDATQPTTYLFDDTYQFIILTSLKNQQLARKIRQLYSPLIKRMTFVSQERDTGLNATVVLNPHDDWTLTAPNAKDVPWTIYELFRLLLDPKRAPHGAHSQFYFVMHDTTFPLLDQIKWRMDRYLAAYHQSYPNFVGGRKTEMKFAKSFWKEQGDAAAQIFGGKKLFAVPSYMYGFDHQFLQAIADFTSTDSCPLLPTEGQSLAGLVECAGGVLEQTEYDFILQTRSNHREKGIKPDSPLSVWRTFDAFNGCNTPGMLQEAYDSYYGQLKAPPPVVPEPQKE